MTFSRKLHQLWRAITTCLRDYVIWRYCSKFNLSFAPLLCAFCWATNFCHFLWLAKPVLKSRLGSKHGGQWRRFATTLAKPCAGSVSSALLHNPINRFRAVLEDRGHGRNGHKHRNTHRAVLKDWSQSPQYLQIGTRRKRGHGPQGQNPNNIYGAVLGESGYTQTVPKGRFPPPKYLQGDTRRRGNDRCGQNSGSTWMVEVALWSTQKSIERVETAIPAMQVLSSSSVLKEVFFLLFSDPLKKDITLEIQGQNLP